MIVLAIDTALAACSAAVLDMRGPEERVFKRMKPMARGHAEALMPLLDELLGESELSLGDVDQFAVTVGPGTFTGVRVGVATARGFALATGRPAVGITTLEALAATAWMAEAAAGPLLVAMDARRGEIYAQGFDAAGRAATEPAVAPVAEVLASLQPDITSTFGSAASLCAEEALRQGRRLEVIGQDAAPHPAAVARLAIGRTAVHSLVPFYMRPPDARPQSGGVSRK